MTQTQDSVQWPFTHAARNIEIVGAGGAYLIQADGHRDCSTQPAAPSS